MFRRRHEQVPVGAEESMLIELWYNSIDPAQRYLGPHLKLTKIEEACEDREESGGNV